MDQDLDTTKKRQNHRNNARLAWHKYAENKRMREFVAKEKKRDERLELRWIANGVCMLH